MGKRDKTIPPDERELDPASGTGPEVTPEQREKLARCCAFFKAERYREATPATLRESDVEIADEVIEQVIETSCRPKSRRGRSTQ